jgi:hypothetical protein
MATSNTKPLLAHCDDPDEAARSVCNVLSFMSIVFRDRIDFGGSQAALDGAGLILETCADTLDFHLTKEGGAA